jgi:hypothetical protein
VIRHKTSTDQVSTLLCNIQLEGLAAAQPTNMALNGSKAFAAAQDVIKTLLDDNGTDGDEKAVRLGPSVNRFSTSGKPKEGSSSEDRHRPRRKWSCTRFRRGLPRQMKSGTSLERCGHSDK